MDKEYVLQVAETAKNQLLATTPMNVILSWGVEKFIATVFKEMPALRFRVNGRLFKGFVIVALNGSDYYEIYLMNYQETKCVTDRAFFDEVRTPDLSFVFQFFSFIAFQLEMSYICFF